MIYCIYSYLILSNVISLSQQYWKDYTTVSFVSLCYVLFKTLAIKKDQQYN